jgi:hypothetical protein
MKIESLGKAGFYRSKFLIRGFAGKGSAEGHNGNQEQRARYQLLEELALHSVD